MSFQWLIFVFFFKQKTAYEMRISDWSSDVCSSDLDRTLAEQLGPLRQAPRGVVAQEGAQCRPQPRDDAHQRADHRAACDRRHHEPRVLPRHAAVVAAGRLWQMDDGSFAAGLHLAQQRSVEHTSELQSLMRISYAVFC